MFVPQTFTVVQVVLVLVIGIGVLGYAFMGKAHSNAFKKIVEAAKA